MRRTSRLPRKAATIFSGLIGMTAVTVLAVTVPAVAVPAVAVAAGAPARAATAAGKPPPPVTLPGSAAPRPPAGATGLGAVPAATPVRLEVTLKVRDQAGLTAFLAAVADRHSPLFGHFLAPGQFGPRFGATPAQLAAVRAALRAAGLSPGAAAADRLSVPVTATAGAVARALGTPLVRYRLRGGRTAYANTAAPRLPAAVAPLVSAVIGLDTLYPQVSMTSPVPGGSRPGTALATVGPPGTGTAPAGAVPASSAPRACAAARDTASLYGGFTAGQLAARYGLSPLYGPGDLGAGTRVALVEFEPNLAADIAAYKRCYGITTPVSYRPVDGGAGTGAGSAEAALDIETVAGLAPGAAIDVYQAPNTGTGNYDDYQAIVSADADKTVSTSWGLCEDYLGQSAAEAMESLFEQADAQGQTVLAAAGDTGSTECLQAGGSDAGAVNALTPASLPYVLGVGGTSARASAETVWNQSANQAGAGGGGISGLWCMPAYQYRTAIPGLVNADSRTRSGCPAATGRYLRQVPDIAADADPYTGYVIDWDGGWTGIGGTSAAAPLWAAAAALTDASPFCAAYGSGAPGMLPPGLYAAVAADHRYVYPASGQVAEAVRDITSGNDDYTPSGYAGGLYRAGHGFDEATGLGAPLLTGLDRAGKPSMYYPGLAALLCRAYATRLTAASRVTSVSPARGRAGHPVTLTVRGSGFLPVAGADVAVAGSVRVTARCASSTACTVTLPAEPARTVDVRISAEDGPASPPVKGDRFQYVAAPAAGQRRAQLPT